MRGALVMTMAMISPSGREVSPAEQSRSNPRLAPPRFCLVAAEFHLRRWLMLFFPSKDSIYQKMATGGPRGGPRGRGAPRGVGRAPHPCGRPGTLLAQLFYSGGFFWSIKNHQKLARQLDSVWYSFSVKIKNKEKTGTGL